MTTMSGFMRAIWETYQFLAALHSAVNLLLFPTSSPKFLSMAGHWLWVSSTTVYPCAWAARIVGVQAMPKESPSTTSFFAGFGPPVAGKVHCANVAGLTLPQVFHSGPCASFTWSTDGRSLGNVNAANAV